MEDKKIKAIVMSGVGYQGNPREIRSDGEGLIEFVASGTDGWYWKGDEKFNGRFVFHVIYY